MSACFADIKLEHTEMDSSDTDCQGHQTASFGKYQCTVEGNSASIFVRKVSPGIFVIKEK